MKFSASLLLMVGLAACSPAAPAMLSLPPASADSAVTTTVTVDVGNDGAFLAKAGRIADVAADGQRHTIDLAFYIYGDDFTSSYLSTQLLAAAQRGSKVRLLVDAGYNHRLRPFYQMLMANSGSTDGVPNLEVAYFRPVDSQVLADLQAWGFSADDAQALVDALLGFDPATISTLLARNTAIAAGTRLAQTVSTAIALFAPPGSDAAAVAGALPVVQRLIPLAPTLATVGGAVTQLLADDGGAPPPLHLDAWVRTAKLLHYKLVIVDGRYVQSGGRNVEDAYQMEIDNPLRAQDKDPVSFMDADFFVDDAQVGAAAERTFQAFWDCRDAAAACAAGIPVISEQAADAPDLLATLQQRAADYATTMGLQPGTTRYARSQAPVQEHRFVAPAAPVRFIENRMFVDAGASSAMLPEEPSGYHRAWVDAIDALPAGAPIVIQNAYLFLPTDLQLALERAIARGSSVTLVTNSPSSSDLGFMAKLARFQYAQLLRLPNTRVVEYRTREALHAKVAMLGDTLIVGSCNADPRSELLDAQDGLLIGPGAVADGALTFDSLAAAYRAWLLDRLTSLTAQGLAADVTLDGLAAERDQVVAALTERGLPAQAATDAITAIDSLFATSFQTDATGQPTDAAQAALGTLQAIFFEL
jgi:phosphatidylserine/phosphatidylglycerophosphate/cardiolipin synthase-like enzyme